MKKNKKIGLGIIAVVLVLIISLLVWQWNNIKAIYMGITYSDNKIETKINATKEKLGKKLEEEGVVNKKIIEGFSKDDEEKIAKGEITIEEAVEKLFELEEGSSADSNADLNTQNSENSADKQAMNSEQKSNKSDVAAVDNNDVVNSQQDQEDNNASPSKTLIEAAVKEMYTLKASYVQQLAAIERSAKKMYIQGEMTKERKFEIADLVMPQLVSAEKSCDAEVEAILTELKNELNLIGADVSVVEYIREQYKNEKQLQKSKYINKYM